MPICIMNSACKDSADFVLVAAAIAAVTAVMHVLTSVRHESQFLL